MICSDNSRCKKFDLIEVDDMFICKNYNHLKLLLIAVKKRFIIPYCRNCKKIVYV